MIFKITEITKVKFGLQGMTQKVLELLETWYRYLSRVRRDAYSFWGQIWGHGAKRSKFLCSNSKGFRAIKLKPSISFSHRILGKSIRFGVMTLIFKVTKVKVGFQSTTQNVSELST